MSMLRKRLIALAIAGPILVVMAAVVAGVGPWQEAGAGEPEDDFSALAKSIFIDNVLALEVLGVLLTAAMIGAMVIARPLGSRPDLEEHYPTRLDRHDAAAIAHLSDVEEDLHFHGQEPLHVTRVTPPAGSPAGGEEE